jgi:hypothetical protein
MRQYVLLGTGYDSDTLIDAELRVRQSRFCQISVMKEAGIAAAATCGGSSNMAARPKGGRYRNQEPGC